MKDVRVVGLAKTFGKASAVDHVDFEVSAGSLVTLLGPTLSCCLRSLRDDIQRCLDRRIPMRGGRPMSALRALGLLLLLSGFSAACYNPRLPDYVALSSREYVHKSTLNDLTVAIHPLVSQTEVEKYFGTNLLARDILPVLIVAENRHASSSFIVRKQGMQLLNEGVQSVGPDRRRRVGSSDAATGVAVAGSVLLSPMLIGIAGAMLAESSEIKRNFAMKEFQQAIIAPGETRSGFVYFQLPEISDSPDLWRLELQVLEPKEKASLTYVYIFAWKRK